MADQQDPSALFEWRALEHVHQFHKAEWYAAFAALVTLVALGFIFMGNFIATLTIAMIGGYMFVVSQHKPSQARYRIMASGVAVNNTLYQYKDLDVFNIIYEPGDVKTVILRSSKRFVPLIHMEIGDADPVAIRELLVQFVREDPSLEESIIDVWARRLGL